MEASPATRPRFVALGLVLALAAWLYWPILGHDLVYDDVTVVARNPRIASFAQVPEQFSSGMWDFLEPNEKDRVGYWRPLTDVALTCANVWGGGSKAAFHALSLALHLAATLAAFALAWRLTKHTLMAASAALLFALHPLQVESVAWLSAVNGPLFGALALLSIERFLAWRERGAQGVAWSSALLLFAALLAKELALAVLPCLFVLDLLRSGAQGAWLERLRPLARGYGALAAALGLYLCARVLVFGPGAGFDLTTTHYVGVAADRLALLRVELLGGYLALLAWPAHLNLFRPFEPGLTAFDAGMLAAWLGMLGLGAALVLTRRLRWSLALGAVLFTALALAPALVRVESLGIFPLSERFAYLSVFGFALALAWSLQRLLPSWAAVLVVCALGGMYFVRSRERIADWKDEPTLFAEAARASPTSPYVQWVSGRVLLERYRAGSQNPTRGDLDQLVAAKDAFERSLELANAAQKGDPKIFAVVDDFIEANIGLGWYYLYEAEFDPYHDYETPLRIFHSVVERYPEAENAYHAYGVALLQMGRLEEGEQALRKATELNPRYASAWNALGKLRLRRGRAQEAAEAFARALELRPDELDDLDWLAAARAQTNDLDGAQALFERAQRRHPTESAPLVWLANLRAQRGDFTGAEELVRRALELNPDDGEGLLLSAKLHARAGETNAAKRALLRATELLTSSYEAHFNAGQLLLQEPGTGLAQALPFLLRAYALRPPGAGGEALRQQFQGFQLADPGLIWELASTDATRGDDASSMEWIERALALDPHHGPSHYLKGFLLRKRNDVEGALESWKLARAELPASFQARQSLGSLLVEQKRYAEALPYLQEALELAQRAQGQNLQAQDALTNLRRLIDEVRGQAGQ